MMFNMERRFAVVIAATILLVGRSVLAQDVRRSPAADSQALDLDSNIIQTLYGERDSANLGFQLVSLGDALGDGSRILAVGSLVDRDGATCLLRCTAGRCTSIQCGIPGTPELAGHFHREPALGLLVSRAFRKGAGAWLTAYHWLAGKLDTAHFDTLPPGYLTSSLVPVGVGDLDGDGLDEIVTDTDVGATLVFKFTDSGLVRAPWFIYPRKSLQRIGAFSVGDINNDGVADLILPQDSGSKWQFTGTFIPGRRGATPDTSKRVEWSLPIQPRGYIDFWSYQLLTGPFLADSLVDFAYALNMIDSIGLNISRIYVF